MLTRASLPPLFSLFYQLGFALRHREGQSPRTAIRRLTAHVKPFPSPCESKWWIAAIHGAPPQCGVPEPVWTACHTQGAAIQCSHVSEAAASRRHQEPSGVRLRSSARRRTVILRFSAATYRFVEQVAHDLVDALA